MNTAEMHAMHNRKVNHQRFIDINHNKEYLSDKVAKKKQFKHTKKNRRSKDNRKLVDDDSSNSFD